MQLDEVPRARLSTVTREAGQRRPSRRPDASPGWAVAPARSVARRCPASFMEPPAAAPMRPWSVSALETYTTCPFKFFAQHVLKLEEEPDDEEVMDPRRQGQFVHKVFETFFSEWQASGHRAITAANLDDRHERCSPRSSIARCAVCPKAKPASNERGCSGRPLRPDSAKPSFAWKPSVRSPWSSVCSSTSCAGRSRSSTDSGSREVQLRGKADRVDLARRRNVSADRLQARMAARSCDGRCSCRSTACAPSSGSRPSRPALDARRGGVSGLQRAEARGAAVCRPQPRGRRASQGAAASRRHPRRDRAR